MSGSAEAFLVLWLVGSALFALRVRASDHRRRLLPAIRAVAEASDEVVRAIARMQTEFEAANDAARRFARFFR